MSSGWLTTALILFPVAGALLLWVLPLRPFAVGSTALLFALVEVGLWIDSVAQFDFSQPGLQLDQRTSWFSDLHVSYHVG
jgi:NADH:ubiquinone oxidoreductase subunit 4 (subunit M)